MGTSNLPLILASGSRYRLHQLQHQLNVTPKQIVTNIDESPLSEETPEQVAKRLSLAKANAGASMLQGDGIIIAADQTADWAGSLLKKPNDRETAIAQLCSFSGQSITFYSGLCVLNSTNGQYLCDSVSTEVKFRTLSTAQIEVYVDHDEPFDCVGAFKNESLGITLFESISSQDPSALTGLPLIKLNHFLLSMGIDVLQQ